MMTQQTRYRAEALRAEIANAGDFSTPVTGRGEMLVSRILTEVDAGELPAAVLEEVPLGLRRSDLSAFFAELASQPEDDPDYADYGATAEMARNAMLQCGDYLADIGDGRGYRLATVLIEEMLDRGFEEIEPLILRETGTLAPPH